MVSEPEWLIPSDRLPIATQVSNNNASLLLTADRWFVAWRTGPIHFASPEVEMHVISSADEGATWDHEHTVALGTDVREPALLWWDGRVSLGWFQGGVEPLKFEPQAVWRAERCDLGVWDDRVIAEEVRVPWDEKVRGGRLLRTSYTGDHYLPEAELDLHFEESVDGGVTYAEVGEGPVYRGGNSEAAFELDASGALWAVTRNEDGDDTGKGSMVCTAPADALGAWDCPTVSDPNRYDSPELIRHGDELYLLARRDVGGVFGEDASMLDYSLRPKRSALYRVDLPSRSVEHVFDIPGVGDTAFVQARRTGPHSWLFVNYTSPLDEPDIHWLDGQTNPRGTQIYLSTLTFD